MTRQLSKRQLSTLRRRVYSANYRAKREYGREEMLDWQHLVADFTPPLGKHWEIECEYCGKRLTPSTVSLDHRIPLVDAGPNEWANIALACRKCNRYKRAIPAEEFRAFIAHLEAGNFLQLFFANYRPQGYRRH